MKVTHYQEPWEHLVVDDILDDEDFEVFLDALGNIKPVPPANLGWYAVEVAKDVHSVEFRTSAGAPEGEGRMWTDLFDRSWTQQLYDRMSPKILKWAQELGSSPEAIEQGRINFGMQTATQGHHEGIHCDTVYKELTIVVYLDPEEATGTIVLDKDKQKVKTVEWKPNRAIVFRRVNKKIPKFANYPPESFTWHDWYADVPERTVILMNLINPLTMKGDVIEGDY